MSKFKKGQKVWSLKYGPGLVVAIESPAQDDYPVTVSFKSVSGFIREEAYMMNGKLYAPDYTLDLYVKKPVILSKQRLNQLTQKYLETHGETVIHLHIEANEE